MMKIDRKHAGFTMAELLITVAIVLALSAVAFVGVSQYERSMTQLEWDSAAREIFVVAQNHLTMAYSQGYPGVEEPADRSVADNPFGVYEGRSETDETSQDGDYFLVVNNGVVPVSAARIFEMLLPWGSIEDAERSGNYVIRYNKEAGIVKDVFYSGQTGKFAHVYEAPTTYFSDALKLYTDENRSARRDYNGSVLGYFGGAQASELLELDIDQPLLSIVNGDRLLVKLELTELNYDHYINKSTGNNTGFTFYVSVTGRTSGKQKIFRMEDFETQQPGDDRTFTLVLDDVTTSGKKFSELCAELYPGEDLNIQAVCYSTSRLAPVRYSGILVTNSLFADGSTVTPTDAEKTPASVDAAISSFRHLENMSPSISGIDNKNTGNVYLKSAKQMADLNWPDFVSNVGGSVHFHIDAAVSSEADTFIPVNPELPVTYDGQSHSITGVPIKVTAASTGAGLFGALASGSVVKNLELVNFNVSGTANAGALAGTVTAPAKTGETPDTVVNVLAHNTGDDRALEINGAGLTGGLIGSMTGGSVIDCAAALYVKSTGGSAGGLIGSADSVAVSDSYSGGHIGSGGQYLDVVTANAAGRVNVQAGDSAGGLIGTMSGGTVQSCYSTCSVRGATAGGFAGSIINTSPKVTNSYCTGLVLCSTMPVPKTDATVNAFVGSGSLLSQSEANWYFSIVNDNYYTAYREEKVAAEERDNVAGELRESLPGTAAFDEARATQSAIEVYQAFCPPSLNPALPYSTELTNLYQGRYPYKTIRQLDTANTRVGRQLITHYGDWPAPELLVYNDAS